jgi:hypothetical protein
VEPSSETPSPERALDPALHNPSAFLRELRDLAVDR